ncbi:hypothetical protein Tco_1017303 [Tanacetum coccineum]|uniref:Uncharacterized protein n=1 Tax=Tanacetum coccineum TaxID=301880 RepID=A0ABQ5FSG8_9ASTR
MVVQNQSELGEGSANPTDAHHTPTITQSSTQPQKTQKPRKPRKDTQVPQPIDPGENVADEAVHKELGDSLVRAATTASSLETEQDSGGGPRCQETMGDTIAQTRFENVSKHLNDSPLARAKFNEERLAREKAKKEEEANIALIETWDDIQVKIDVDHQLAKIMQAQEQEELFIEENASLFQQLLEKRRKHFAAKRSEEKRNKPPTKAQQRKIMCTYLKNMKGYKLKDLKLKELILSKRYLTEHLKREDLEDLYKLVKDKYESTRPVKDLDLLLSGDLKTMFEPHVEDKIYMLVEKKYPLAPLTLSMMLENELMIDYESEMAYQLLKFIIKQLKK